MLTTTAMVALGGIASVLASLYEGGSGMALAGDLVLAASTTLGLAIARSRR
jgi:hypothetical protein